MRNSVIYCFIVGTSLVNQQSGSDKNEFVWVVWRPQSYYIATASASASTIEMAQGEQVRRV